MSTLRISFQSWWGGWNAENNYFTNALRNCLSDRVIVDDNDPDIIFYSVFGDTPSNGKGKKVFYTGENREPRPDADLNITFRPDEGNNIRLPLWALYIDWFNTDPTGPRGIHYNERRQLAPSDRHGLCSFIYSNPAEGTPRIDFFRALRDRFSTQLVDSAGPLLNTTGKRLGGDELDKIKFMTKYKYSICFENSLSEGYVTEKLYHGLLTGVPIYWGDTWADIDFNSNAFIRLNENNFNEVLERLYFLERNPDYRYSFLIEPMFRNNLPPMHVQPAIVVSKILMALNI